MIGGRNTFRILAGFALLLLLSATFSYLTLFSGTVGLSWSDVFVDDGSVLNRIFWDLRVPRLVAAVLAGISLAVSGLSLQTLFRNPLAGPFVLGISSGASLGVALSLLAGFSFGHFGVLTSAAVGAFAVTFLVMFVSNHFRSSTVLLIVGLLVGYFIDALVNLLIVGSDAEALKVFVSWGMGSFCRLTSDGIWIFALAVIVGCVLIGVSIRYLNAIRMGEDFAKGLGVNAFVGIAVPHLAFMLFKTGNHRLLLPGSALCGVTLCLAAGLFTMVPLNAILSLVGVPVVLLVITRGRGGRG